MENKIYRSIQEPIRQGLSTQDRWKDADGGLITCWEVGREKIVKNPELAERARNGELPVLGWKGGVEKKMVQKEKYGSLHYLAQWQGLRGEDLDISITEDTEVVCTKTQVKVIFTADLKKCAESESSGDQIELCGD
jgi:hypothetical protein